MAASPVIGRIKEKIGELIAENKRLRGEKEKIAERNEKLALRNEALSAKVSELEKRIQVLEIGEALSGTAENSRIARARINRLMREIDKCIALLNR